MVKNCHLRAITHAKNKLTIFQSCCLNNSSCLAGKFVLYSFSLTTTVCTINTKVGKYPHSQVVQKLYFGVDCFSHGGLFVGLVLLIDFNNL